MSKLVLLRPFLAVPVLVTDSDRLCAHKMASAYTTASVLQFGERDHTETQSCFCSEGYILHSGFNSVPSEVSRNISSGLRVRCLSQSVVLSDGIWVTFKHGISVNVWPWWALLRVAASAVSRFGSCGWTFLKPGGAVLGRQEGGCSEDRGSARNTACKRNRVITADPTWKIQQPAFEKGERRLCVRRS